ncbi:hypothetical protein R3P82_13990 [Dietzia maris]|uniref:Uncharacterized protein n=1 Tax=Dietzia maris TaxID=37915 RepID=A0AAE4QZU6_9ACTN|nr:hypothetical protein [Dietzia maris]MDV6300213.1 hypothetical protein [Dietzia maris]
MSTKITADNGVELEVCHLGIDATNPNRTEPSSIWARLTAEQRTKLAAALAPERTPILEGRPVHGITVTGYVGDAPINPADCDRTTVYTGECRNFADTEWIRFESGRRRSPDARDGNTWLIDVAYGSFWMADDKVRNLAPLVPAPAGGQWTRDDLPSLPDVLGEVTTHECGEGAAAYRTAALTHLNAHHPKPVQAVCAQSGDDEPMMPRETLRERTASDGRLWNQAYAEGVASAERTCNELRSLIEGQKEHVTKAQRERDDEKSRSEFFAKRADEARRERDAAVARAEQSEQLIPAYAMLDVWGALGRDSIHFDDWYDERGYADAWAELAAAVREAAEARTAPAVSRADIEKAILPHILYPANGTQDLIDDVHALVSGDDPAVYVVRESDLPDLELVAARNFDLANGQTKFRDATADEVDEAVDDVASDLRYVLAARRAIEAEQAVDPVDEQTDSLADILYGHEMVTDQMRGVLERVVRAGMLFPEQETDQ